MRILGIIPARFASTRFPGKPLADINGKSMIRRVYEQSLKASTLTDLIVATDDERIIAEVNGFGGKALMTSPAHQSGTDRCAEVLDRQKGAYDAVINIQGDEPFIDPGQIDLLASCFKDERTEIATLVKKIQTEAELFNSSIPKVVLDIQGLALYFSRQPVPFIRGKEEKDWLKEHIFYKHIGIYGYRTDVLQKIAVLPLSSLEKAESLEQLRWLENGYKIKTAVTTFNSIAVDTPDDLEKIRDYR